MTHATGGGTPPNQNAPALSGRTMYVLVTLTTLLMGFSIVSWTLKNPTLAAAAGVGAITLVADIVRRLLGANPSIPAVGAVGGSPAIAAPGPDFPATPLGTFGPSPGPDPAPEPRLGDWSPGGDNSQGV